MPHVSSPIWIESRRTNSSESSLGPTLQTDRFVGPTWVLFFPILKLQCVQGLRAKNHIRSQAVEYYEVAVCSHTASGPGQAGPHISEPLWLFACNEGSHRFYAKR